MDAKELAEKIRNYVVKEMNKAMENKVKKIIKRLEQIIKCSIEEGDYEKAMACMETSARIQYQYNQEYKDEYIEDSIIKLSKVQNLTKNVSSIDKCAVFYDGFGFDTRGLALIYLKALADLNYKIIYIDAGRVEKSLSQITSVVKSSNGKFYRIPINFSFQERLNRIRKCLDSVGAEVSFFYTTPDDVCGAVAFYEQKGRMRRFQINLTDHAFWIGLKSFDYSIEFRDYGASISYYYRGLNKEQLLKLPYYPSINYGTKFKGFDFVPKGKKIIFSGGQLYKTIDSQMTYYKLVEYIVKKHSDVIFWYAGSGDSNAFDKLKKSYPQQIYLTSERDDLYALLEHCYLYLNTYPISGGLMLQYAAKAKCIPITLKREWDDDSGGALINEEILGETFTEFDDICREIDHLLEDKNYWKAKRELLENSVISEDEFRKQLGRILEQPELCCIEHIEKVDTKMFRQTYRENISSSDIDTAIATKRNKLLIRYFPICFLRRLFNLIIGNKKEIS